MLSITTSMPSSNGITFIDFPSPLTLFISCYVFHNTIPLSTTVTTLGVTLPNNVLL